MKNYQWLAEVRVKVGDKKYSLSTGVPLSRRYILTTGHGVPKPDDKKRQAEVRFVADFHHKHSWRPAKTVWHGGEELDAALLDIAELRYDEASSFHAVHYSNALPVETKPWEGAGFPAAGKITAGELTGERDSEGLNGDYLPGGYGKSQLLELTVKSPPRIAGKWAGLSGAPVFCESKLIGIIKSCPENFDGHRLAAVSMRRLLENAELRKLLGYDEREKLLAQQLVKIETLLASSKEVLSALHAQPALAGKVKNPKAVAEALQNMPVEPFILTVYQASFDKNVRQDKARQVMEALLGELLPWLYDAGLVESVRLNLSPGMLFSLPAATETIAEIILAGVERRPAAFRRPVPGEEYPIGEPVIEFPPETGFTPAQDDAASAFDEHMFNKFARADRHRVGDNTVLRQLVNRELNYIATKRMTGRFRHYFICQVPRTGAENSTLLLIQKNYPELIFICLSHESLVNERDLCKPLRDFFAPTFGEDAA
ncbi:hypothetical protein HUU40_17830 [candidate division KSB1 bacterium]|nr:hypothetical protein [candidate division KSB1 bacterium]